MSEVPEPGTGRSRGRSGLWLLLLAVPLAAGSLYVLSAPAGPLSPPGELLDPVDGLYASARAAGYTAEELVAIPQLAQPVTVIRDERGVPHIFAASDRDAVITLGYVVAQDRLFQIDFLSRVGSGRLSEVLGPSAVEMDRFLRQTGMERGVHRNLERLNREGGIEKDLAQWYGIGVNAWISQLEAADLPFEMRLLGYEPQPYTVTTALRVLQYMTLDLTFRTDEPALDAVRKKLDPGERSRLYPSQSWLYRPIIPLLPGEPVGGMINGPVYGSSLRESVAAKGIAAGTPLEEWLNGTIAEGYLHGKGSNNWAVHGNRSSTGAPILAGDMHLRLTLPAIWYEAHIVTPTINAYGVTIPGAPILVEAYNDFVGWAFTNTGLDQVDHYALEIDSSASRYRYNDTWRAFETKLDTIYVKGAEPVVDTLYASHWGPALVGQERAIAIRWVGHETSRTLRALWEMIHAVDLASFDRATRFWDTPSQNILAADIYGNIAIRATGYLPIRAGKTGAGLLDGSSDSDAWVGRIPFDELPHARNPEIGYLTSTNQQPIGAGYPYYLKGDWQDSYRSLRIDQLLGSKPRHSVEDVIRYQSDVHAVQRDLFVPLLDTLSGLSERADTLRSLLVRWNGETATDLPQPLILDEFLSTLERNVWDEEVFGQPVHLLTYDQSRRTVGRSILKTSPPRPNQTDLYRLLIEHPESGWFDRVSTPVREHAGDILRQSLEETADSLWIRYGEKIDDWQWGKHHRIEFRHLLQSDATRALSRGPFPYPGFEGTLSPAGSRLTHHSASWRMVVDFSKRPPQGFGVYPGGQSGNPFSPLYDSHLSRYLSFTLFDLHKPVSPSDLDPENVLSTLRLIPGGR